MNSERIFSDLLAWALQSSFLLLIALLLPRVLHLKRPEMRLAYYYSLLLIVLFLPFLGSLDLGSGGKKVIPSVSVQMIVTEPLEGAQDSSLFAAALLFLGVVTGVRMLRFGAGFIGLNLYRRNSTALEPVPAPVRDLAEELGFQAELRTCNRLDSPLAFGWKRPLVLFPTAFLTHCSEEQVTIACHELLHLKRYDWIAAVAERFLGAVLWFHPMLHLLLERIDLSREQVIDRQVVQRTGHIRPYLRALRLTAESFRRAPVAPTIPFIRASHLKERVFLLTQEVEMTRWSLVFRGSILIFAVAFLSLMALFAFPLSEGVNLAQMDAGILSPAAVPYAGLSRQQEDDSELFTEKELVPKLVKKVLPEYPEDARKEGLQGSVICKATIDREGKVVSVKVKESSDDALSEAAVKALRQWEYEPATYEGRPVSVHFTVTIKFALK